MKKIKLADLCPHPKNPRQITEARLAKLIRSIDEFPEMLALRPIIVDEDNIVLAGSMRLRAFRAKGMKEIPAAWVRRVEGWPEDKKLEFVIRDNTEAGDWDWGMLEKDWDEPLSDWGLDLQTTQKRPFEAVDGITEEIECPECHERFTP